MIKTLLKIRKIKNIYLSNVFYSFYALLLRFQTLSRGGEVFNMKLLNSIRVIQIYNDTQGKVPTSNATRDKLNNRLIIFFFSADVYPDFSLLISRQPDINLRVVFLRWLD